MEAAAYGEGRAIAIRLIARLYGAGQLDGVLKMQRFKRVGVNSCRFGTDRGTGRNMQRLRRRRMRCFDASFYR